MAGKIGNKGGRRKSAYQEKADATRLFDAYFGENNLAEISKRIESGKFSIWDRVLYLALGGNERMLSVLTSKAFPDRIEPPDGEEYYTIIVKGRKNSRTPR
jgi:hypothetical protein